MFSQNSLKLAWLKWLFYLFGAALAISGSFLTWVHWTHGCDVLIHDETTGLDLDLGHRPIPVVKDHGGLVIVLLSAATVAIAFCAHLFDKRPEELVLVTSALLVLIAGYRILSVQAIGQAYRERTWHMSGTYMMYPGEGLRRVFIGSLLMLFAAALDYHFTRLQRLLEQGGRKKSSQKAFHFGWASWLWWVLASAIGLVLGSTASKILWSTWNHPWFSVYKCVYWILPTSCGLVLGASVGIAQWFVLRRHITQAGWWILASAAGWMTSLSAYWFMRSYIGLYVRWKPLWYVVFPTHLQDLGFSLPIAFFIVVGTLVGALQWLVLKRHVSLSGWWVLANTVGVTTAGAIWIIYFRDLPRASFVFGGVSGAFTGLVLIWLRWQKRLGA